MVNLRSFSAPETRYFGHHSTHNFSVHEEKLLKFGAFNRKRCYKGVLCFMTETVLGSVTQTVLRNQIACIE